MPTFNYEARKEGQLMRGTIEAPNLRQATQELQRQGVTVINIREASTGAGCGAAVVLAPVLVALGLHMVHVL